MPCAARSMLRFSTSRPGTRARAEAKLREVIAPLPPGPIRARAVVVLARVRLYEAPAEARELFLQVVAEAGGDRLTLALAHEGVSACSVWMFERLDEALEHGSIALELATELDDRPLLGDVLMVRVGVETLLGSATAAATAERALSLQEDSAEARRLGSAAPRRGRELDLDGCPRSSPRCAHRSPRAGRGAG